MPKKIESLRRKYSGNNGLIRKKLRLFDKSLGTHFVIQ